MNKIFSEIKEIMKECVEKYIPEITLNDLESEGAVFYMNGKNGTEFDWYVNDKISDFMMFYNDEENLGAVKATLYNNGEVLIYVYGDCGKTINQRLKTSIEASEEELLKLAVVLRNEADNKKIWDENIEKINTEVEPDAAQMEKYISEANLYTDMRARKLMLGQVAYVSKKIMDEGWKIGYMCRDEAINENDSGWCFMAGNEEDDYMNDYQNIMVMNINEVIKYDNVIWTYINNAVGTSLIRISSDEFEIDNNDKEIYMEKKEQ